MRIKYFIRSFIWANLILVVCLLPKSNVPKVQLINIPHFDKWVHGGMFLILTVLLLIDFSRLSKFSEQKKTYFVSVFCISVLHGGFIELLQAYFSPTRSGDWFDWLADIAGVLLGIFLGKFFLKRLKTISP